MHTDDVQSQPEPCMAQFDLRPSSRLPMTRIHYGNFADFKEHFSVSPLRSSSIRVLTQDHAVGLHAGTRSFFRSRRLDHGLSFRSFASESEEHAAEYAWVSSDRSLAKFCR